MDRRSLFALLTLFLLVGATGAAVAKSDDDAEDARGRGADDDPGDDRREGREGRGNDDDDDDDDDDRVHFVHRGDRWLYHNDHVAVAFHQTGSGKASPDLRVFVNGTDGNATGYRVKLLRLYEAEGDDLSHSGRLNRINLAKAQDWHVQTTEANESLTLTMTHAEAQGIVTFVWRLNTTSAEVKFDMKVDGWQWAENATGHRLVLDMLVVGRDLRNATGANVTVEDAGYISWATTATASYGENDTRTIDVTAHQKRSDDDDDDADDDDDGSGTHLLLVFDGAPGYAALDYDPTFGVQTQSSGVQERATVPGAALGLVGLAVAAAAGLAGRTRRR